MIGIYQIRNLVTGHRYIGSSINIESRWSDYRYSLARGFHDNSILQRAWDKYGEKNFLFEVLEECIDPLVREQVYLDNVKPEYNMNPIASRPPDQTGRTYSEERRATMSEEMSRRHRDGVYPTTIGDSQRGKVRSEEYRKKLGDGRRGKVHSEETKERIRESLRLTRLKKEVGS